jgi:hypothetical protein
MLRTVIKKRILAKTHLRKSTKYSHSAQNPEAESFASLSVRYQAALHPANSAVLKCSGAEVQWYLYQF